MKATQPAFKRDDGTNAVGDFYFFIEEANMPVAQATS
jgi:hypothetical protein